MTNRNFAPYSKSLDPKARDDLRRVLIRDQADRAANRDAAMRYVPQVSRL
jgi:hypothetical protein